MRVNLVGKVLGRLDDLVRVKAMFWPEVLDVL
jgi:hypothetical protein